MSGGKKKRKDIQQGLDQSKAFTEQGAAALQPYAQGGRPAFDNANAFLGLGGAAAQQQAGQNFKNSLFYTGGQNAFGLEKDAIDSGLSNQGLLYSSARLNAVEDARQRNYQNALAQYLGLNQAQSGVGFAGASGQAGLYGQQGQNALNAGFQTANTRQGILGNLKTISEIGANFGQAASGFSDRRLKADIKKIDDYGPLSVYHWRWNDAAKELGLSGDEVGFMADEVEQIMPEAVGVKSGYQTVDYGAVMERFAQ